MGAGLIRGDGRTDRHAENGETIFAFRNFGNSPKRGSYDFQFYCQRGLFCLHTFNHKSRDNSLW